MKTNKDYYFSYLFRLWKDNGSGDWRATLQNITSGAVHNFPSAAALFAFIAFRMLDQDSTDLGEEWLDMTTQSLKHLPYRDPSVELDD
ncbi:MAG: hypothetical protein EHM41_16765 [Chloroflexi bacterium]|nr:MAG: hypothetical protein EHM41_16765 [Chloroflexota bacterium]